jgi:hypothetical protein
MTWQIQRQETLLLSSRIEKEEWKYLELVEQSKKGGEREW